MVGSIGEVIAAEALGLKLYPASHPCHDARGPDGDVQIKMTAGKRISMYSCCNRLVVLKVLSAEEAEIIYNGPGLPVWNACGTVAKNGQRSISLSKLQKLQCP
jgi:hypothetical protein